MTSPMEEEGVLADLKNRGEGLHKDINVSKFGLLYVRFVLNNSFKIL
mgnify:CR=1 FL=1